MFSSPRIRKKTKVKPLPNTTQNNPINYTSIYFVLFCKKLKNVSCEYDRWVVETLLCKLRATSDTLIGRACSMFQLKYEYGVSELHIHDMVVDTNKSSSTSFMVGCSRVFYVYS